LTLSRHWHRITQRLTAFDGTGGVFILPASQFDPAPCFPEACEVIDAVATTLKWAQPNKIVCLSTIGVQASEFEQDAAAIIKGAIPLETVLRGLVARAT
jgi:hypothetical protein